MAMSGQVSCLSQSMSARRCLAAALVLLAGLAASLIGFGVALAQQGTTPVQRSYINPFPNGDRYRVVVIGGGFGGLSAVQHLKGAPADITIIDRRNHHLFQPLLYQVATTALSPSEIAWPIRHLLARQANARVLMGEVTAVDAVRKAVLLESGPVPYDLLVLVTGATHGYFGRDEWAAHAPGLKTLDDATAIRRRILLAFERAEAASDPAECARLLTIAIVGGGPTGVEMAGAFAEIARHSLVRDFRRIDPRTARVVLIEAGPRILSAYPEELSRKAQLQLEALGVQVWTGSAVTGMGEGFVLQYPHTSRPGELTKLDTYPKLFSTFKQAVEWLDTVGIRSAGTLNDAFVILDEAQNTTPEQMKMFLTRIGFGSKAVITGDPSQVDLPRGQDSGLAHAVKVLHDVQGIATTRFTSRDVVRHPLVARIVDAYDRAAESEE